MNNTESGNWSKVEIDPITTKSTMEKLEDEAGSEYLVVLPIIVIIGLLGNLASLVTILNTRLRRITANQYLIVLTASDSVFLIGMILIIFKVDYWSYHLCVLVEYVLMASSYVSSWSVVALTIERYIAITHPMKHVKLSHIPRTKIMKYWVPIPFLLNLIQFITLTPNIEDPNGRKCAIASGQLQLITEMSDVLLSYVAPCVIIILLNFIIASTVYRASKGLFAEDKCAEQPLESRSSQRRTGNNNSSSTRILLVVPIVYTLLNTPFYLMRILETLALNLFDSHAFSAQGLGDNKIAVFLYNAAHYLYYINFASDFLVYAFSSKNFRKSVCLAWTKLMCPSSWQQSEKVLRRMDMSSQKTCVVRTTSHQTRPNGDPV